MVFLFIQFYLGKGRRTGSDSSSKFLKISATYMEQVLEKLKDSSLRSSTAKVYHQIWTSFNQFVIRLDRKPGKWEDRVALFCAHLVQTGKQSTTIKSYVSAIKKTLKDDGYQWDQNAILLETLIKACRLLNDRVKTRLPINIGLLELILFEVKRVFTGEQPYLIALYRAIFALAYYGLLRISELTVGPEACHFIRARNIHVGTNKNKILIVLYSSKTHGKESKPQIIKITAKPDGCRKHFCPFTLVRQYMTLRRDYDDDNEPFFVFRENITVSGNHVRKVLRECLTHLNLDSKLYDTHSFRIGMASDMMKNHISIPRIKQAGRWRSNVVYKYIRQM